jgi:hypothetical protein
MIGYPPVIFEDVNHRKMKQPNNLYLGISEPERVGEFLLHSTHPLRELMQHVRSLILNAHPSIGEGIYWNAPTFFYTGKMKPFEAKEYKRYLVGFNLYKQDTLRLILLRGADALDPGGLLTGNFPDKRKMIFFQHVDQANQAKADLTLILRDLIKKIDL